jgi:hypothetical protein
MKRIAHLAGKEVKEKYSSKFQVAGSKLRAHAFDFEPAT